MKIRSIEKRDWDKIFKIQQDAYTEIKPESKAVLESKNRISPKTCMVCVDEKGDILGCCLSHPYNKNKIPPLHKELRDSISSDNLFIHDLAVSSVAKMQGIGTSLVETLLVKAKEYGFKTITLVAVQGADKFWRKFGFLEVHEVKPYSSYGEDIFFMRLEL